MGKQSSEHESRRTLQEKVSANEKPTKPEPERESANPPATIRPYHRQERTLHRGATLAVDPAPMLGTGPE